MNIKIRTKKSLLSLKGFFSRLIKIRLSFFLLKLNKLFFYQFNSLSLAIYNQLNEINTISMIFNIKSLFASI